MNTGVPLFMSLCEVRWCCTAATAVAAAVTAALLLGCFSNAEEFIFFNKMPRMCGLEYTPGSIYQPGTGIV